MDRLTELRIMLVWLEWQIQFLKTELAILEIILEGRNGIPEDDQPGTA